MLRFVGAIVLFCTAAAGFVALAAEAVTDMVGVVAGPLTQNSPAQNHDAPLSDEELASLTAAARMATVRVAGRTCDGLLIGSGFVANDLTITNRHLVAGANEIKIDQPITPVLAPITRRAGGLDLAVAPAMGSSSLILADENARVDETVLLSGHPGGGVAAVVQGRVQLFDNGAPWGIEGEVMLIDGSSSGGFSGGPVLNRKGEVVAVLQGYSPTVDLSIAIPVESMIEWLEAGTDDPIQSCD